MAASWFLLMMMLIAAEMAGGGVGSYLYSDSTCRTPKEQEV